MRKWVFFIGLLGGALVSVTMASPLLALFVSRASPETWSAQSAGTLRWLAVSGGLLLLTGALAGALSGSASRWGAAGAGALAGWSATWVAEALVGGLVMGAYGALPILAHGPKPAESEAQFVALV